MPKAGPVKAILQRRMRALVSGQEIKLEKQKVAATSTAAIEN